MCRAPPGYQKGEWGWLQERPELWHLREKRAWDSRSRGPEGCPLLKDTLRVPGAGSRLLGSREGFMVEATLDVSPTGCAGALQVEDQVDCLSRPVPAEENTASGTQETVHRRQFPLAAA